MPIAPKSFEYELSPSGVATITLSRPERLNSLTFEVYEELSATFAALDADCLLYTSPSPRDKRQSRMPSSA